jgi:calcineurin-like phosphoesterase family protein
MAVFFTSDTHFGHGGALGFFRRPFGSVAAMDAALIRAWNETVGPADEIWHLGDFAVKQGAARMAEILGALAGQKRLVRGNNDSDETAALPLWREVVEAKELVVDGVCLVLTHAPLERVPAGAVNLHGHSHGRRKPRPGWIDVGVDVWDYRPVTWERLRSQPARA